MMKMTLGVDVACRAPDQASLADCQGQLRLEGRRFRTTSEDLEALWRSLPDDVESHGRDGAHPQRVGAAGGVVPTSRCESDHGPRRAVR